MPRWAFVQYKILAPDFIQVNDLSFDTRDQSLKWGQIWSKFLFHAVCRVAPFLPTHLGVVWKSPKFTQKEGISKQRGHSCRDVNPHNLVSAEQFFFKMSGNLPERRGSWRKESTFSRFLTSPSTRHGFGCQDVLEITHSSEEVRIATGKWVKPIIKQLSKNLGTAQGRDRYTVKVKSIFTLCSISQFNGVLMCLSPILPFTLYR